MDRLLTDEESLAVFRTTHNDELSGSMENFWNLVHAENKAQHAKSIKVDRQAAAGWLEQNYGLASMAWLVEALRVNRVPWDNGQS